MALFALPAALSLAALPLLIRRVVIWLIEFYAAHSLAKLATVLTTATIIIALWAAFTGVLYAAIATMQVAAPPQFAFAFGFLPPSLPAMYTGYLSVLSAKRVFDWVVLIRRDAQKTQQQQLRMMQY